jgi:hypothetical protein
VTYGRLSPQVPLGPFTDSPIKVWSAPGKAAKLHASEHCSRLRSDCVTVAQLPLGAVVQRMCPHCAAYGRWAQAGTGVGLFLDAMTGTGLLYELDHYAGPDEDTRTDDEVRQAASVLDRVPRSDQGGLDDAEEGAEDEESDWREVQDARSERTLAFEQWRGAVASLHRAHRLLALFPWLRPWAETPLQHKASHAALLQRQAAQLVSRDALLVAACVAMDVPDLPVQDPALAVLGAPAAVEQDLTSLWRRWSQRSVTSWDHPREHRDVARYLTQGMSGRRKGRDGALACASRLVSAWTQAAQAGAAGVRGERTVLTRLPEPRPERPSQRAEAFLQHVSEWELGVLVSWGVDPDWELLTLTLRVPEAVAARLLSPGSALSCSPADQGGTPKSAAAPEPLVEPGVFDDGPVAERRAVTVGHLRALRALTPNADQLYLVVSAASGPEVMPLSTLEERVRTGGRYVIVAAAGDLPDEVLPPPGELVVEADLAENGSVWPPRIHDPQHPDFGRSLGMAEGERVVERLSRSSLGHKDSGFALRSLALARAVADLRALEGRYDENSNRRGPFPHDVWHGLLAMEQLDLEPFMPVNADQYHDGSGLPLGVLARVQVYTTDAGGQFQGRAHSPGCAHQRYDRGLTSEYDLVTVEELLHTERFDPCSKCGGYAIRRLSEAQVAYYRAAHRLHATASNIRWAVMHREMTRDDDELAAEAKEWSDTKPADEWFSTPSQTRQWRRIVADLHQQTQQLG